LKNFVGFLWKRLRARRKKKERFYSLNKETMEQLFKLFSYHAKKYCPTGGKCLTDKDLQEQKKKNASKSLYLIRH
jgi:hypothetical protein